MGLWCNDGGRDVLVQKRLRPVVAGTRRLHQPRLPRHLQGRCGLGGVDGVVYSGGDKGILVQKRLRPVVAGSRRLHQPRLPRHLQSKCGVGDSVRVGLG